MHFGKIYMHVFSNQYIKMPALIGRGKWKKNMNKPCLIFYIRAEFTLWRESVYGSTIFPFISLILELLCQSSIVLAKLKYITYHSCTTQTF